MLVYRDREKFSSVSEAEVKRVFEPLNPLGLEPLTLGQEGFKVRLWNGRIDCLPGGVHLWCEITPEVLRTLDWLFANAYGLKPPGSLSETMDLCLRSATRSRELFMQVHETSGVTLQ